MSRIILLDAGPLGLLAHPHPTPLSLLCRKWAQDVQAAGSMIHIGEIADYEVRRELLRARKVRSVERLNQLKTDFGYIGITTAAMLQAATYWAHLRQQGIPTADNAALDADVILAAQAALLVRMGHSVVIATTNTRHLVRLVAADLWQNITV